ncbi:MAG: hypothetical protein AAGD15_13665 [Agrobacterium cavarae]|uniref:hypothetical protein n=1 Tax=Agrobacterium cavarae TaxID=2528239 RepID=UPI0031AACC15
MQDPIASGLAGALRGRETWISDPASLVNGTASFLEAMNLGDQVCEVFFDFGLYETAYEALEGQTLLSDQRE